jgi:aminopeptidase YwaD
MKKIIVFIPFVVLTSFSFSQKELAKKLIDTLASDSFYGRGYVNDGDKIAANFIAKKFKEFGAIPVSGDSYFKI